MSHGSTSSMSSGSCLHQGSTPGVDPIRPPIQCVAVAVSSGTKWPLLETHHSRPYSAQEENRWRYAPSWRAHEQHYVYAFVKVK